MARTTAKAVIELLGGDHDGCSSVGVFADTASAVVDRVVACAAAKGVTLSNSEQELIERWLACHFYVQRDQPYQSKSTGGASASFQGSVGQGIEGSKYGLSAIRVDYSGCLINIDKRQVAGGFWGGKTAAEALSYDQRNGGS
jgi:hypothetical protein